VCSSDLPKTPKPHNTEIISNVNQSYLRECSFCFGSSLNNLKIKLGNS